MQPWDKLIESGRLQEILAKGLAFVVYTTFRWNNFNKDFFLWICSLHVNEPFPMGCYENKDLRPIKDAYPPRLSFRDYEN